jgi:hypothetical protein
MFEKHNGSTSESTKTLEKVPSVVSFNEPLVEEPVIAAPEPQAVVETVAESAEDSTQNPVDDSTQTASGVVEDILVAAESLLSPLPRSRTTSEEAGFYLN